MAITSIVIIKNMMRDRVLRYRNLERAPKVVATVDPGLETTDKQDIPWCESPEDFPSHHIEIEIPDHDITYYIWQHKDIDGNFVRCSIDGKFASSKIGPNKKPAWTVPGGARTNREYDAVVTFPGMLEFVPSLAYRPPIFEVRFA